MGAPEEHRMPSIPEQRARRIADRDEPGDHMLLGVVDEDIADAERAEPELRSQACSRALKRSGSPRIRHHAKSRSEARRKR